MGVRHIWRSFQLGASCLHWVPVMYSFGVAGARATSVVLVYDSDVTHVVQKKENVFLVPKD